MCEGPAPRDERPEELLVRAAALLEVRLVGHDADRGDAVSHRDLPGPASLQPQEMEEQHALGAGWVRFDAPEPREDAELVEDGVLVLQPELVGDHAPPARRIDHEAGPDVALPAVAEGDSHAHCAVALEKDRSDVRALDDPRPGLMGVTDQHGVEDVAL